MDIFRQRVMPVLEEKRIPWVVGKDQQGLYAAMQDVTRPYGGFSAYNSLYSDQCRRRNKQPPLAGQEKWVVDNQLDAFLEQTAYPTRPTSLLIANVERIYFFLKLQDDLEPVEPLAQRPAVRFAHLGHDDIKDRLALLCSYCGWHVFNEVPLLGAPTRTGTRRPDLCWFTDAGELWVVDVKTRLSTAVIEDMHERGYQELATRAYGKSPERLIMVMPDYSTPELEAEALTYGYEILTYDAMLNLMLGRVKAIHRAYPKIYENIVANIA